MGSALVIWHSTSQANEPRLTDLKQVNSEHASEVFEADFQHEEHR